MFGDNPLGWETLGTQARRSRRRRATRSSTTSSTWYRPDRHGRRRRRQHRRRAARRGRGAARRPRRPRATGTPPPAQIPNGNAPRVQRPPQGVRPGAHLASASRSLPASSTPTGTRCSCSRPCSAAGMSSRLFTEVRERRGLAYYVYAINHATPTRARSTRRRASTSTASTTRSTTIASELQRIADEPVAAGRAREGARPREGPLRAPDRGAAGPAPVRPAARGARGPRRTSRQEVLAGLDAVTAEDIQRVAQDVIAGGGCGSR